MSKRHSKAVAPFQPIAKRARHVLGEQFSNSNQSVPRQKKTKRNQDHIETKSNASPFQRPQSTTLSEAEKKKNMGPTIKKGKIRMGVRFQAKIPQLLSTVPKQDYKDEKDREERIWAPYESDNKNVVEKKKLEKKFHDDVRDVYFMPIWRQFNGHILFEEALQHLMQNKYNMADSLDTIDEVLKRRPQMIKHARIAQTANLELYGVNEMVSMRDLQQKALPNFSLDEVHHYSFQYIRNFMFHNYWNSLCMCKDKSCTIVEFEPRIGCVNCTKNSRNPSANEKLCLICQTYTALTGKRRPARDVCFTAEEEKTIEQWNTKERDVGKSLRRDQFEKLIKDEDMQRLRNLDITEEEKIILNFSDTETEQNYSRMNKKAKGKYLIDQLKSFKLPLFASCNCKGVKKRQDLIVKQELVLPDECFGKDYIMEFLGNFNPWFDLNEQMEKQKDQ
ncbi:hypothetical protein GCK72_022346 [Caenorhabditis remanei]|uniref:ELM2 domain-containing protein n=1 Tax=Caenorhabditis remanei TaxID=31234 RepID=A0A6A5FTQ4_CAERE|nr:hypothetical protein GCK72_022346 [Caenorhabditis remanei]KAF1745899.1 hypothetical protein GCK72_022346 [Caenorhabditis remanei]